jgi:hypothetical protein
VISVQADVSISGIGSTGNPVPLTYECTPTFETRIGPIWKTIAATDTFACRITLDDTTSTLNAYYTKAVEGTSFQIKTVTIKWLRVTTS